MKWFFFVFFCCISFSQAISYFPIHIHNEWSVPDQSPLQLFTCDGSEGQKWDISQLNVDQTIRLANSRQQCIDISGYGTENGDYVWIYACHTDDKDPKHQNQQWIWDSQKKSITNPLSKRVLDASQYGTSPGTRIWIWEPTGATNQQWVYNTTDSTIRGVASGLCLDVGSVMPRICDVDANKNLSFCNVNLSQKLRIQDLISRIPDSEKWTLFGNGAGYVASVQLPPYQWWSEALHGVGYSPGVSFRGTTPAATSFPQVCTTGATFDKQLWYDIGEAISTEARAFNHEGNAGLTFWAPNLNIFRDPRWGRGQETPGEDPYVTSQYVKYFVQGMQGNDTTYLKVSSCCKHFAAYSLENWQGNDRCSFNAIVTQQDLADTYFPAFESCISPLSGGASSIMCSYNAVNGIPSCANELFMDDYARGKWGFSGYITGDCAAVSCVQNNHHYTNNSDATCSVVLEAGLDVDCGDFLPMNLGKAVANGAVSVGLVNSHLYNLFDVQFRLGLFDPPSRQPYMQITANSINTPAHQQLALKAALEGIVLLKNRNNILPLKINIKVAVIGPNAKATDVLLGNYAGVPPFIVSPLDGISKYASAQFALGCDIDSKNTDNIQPACDLAASSDVTIIIAGLDQSQETEGYDRNSISWPGIQEQMLLKVASCSKTPVVLVILGGGPIDITTEKNSDSIGAIIWAGYPGQSGGDALAKIIFGDVSPSGKLVHTILPANYVNQVPLTDMGMRPNARTGNPGRTYRFYNGTPVYEFGSGLSYTTFTIRWTSLNEIVVPASKIRSQVSHSMYSRFDSEAIATPQAVVINSGNVTSDVVVLAFVVGPNPGKDGNPLKTLVGFERVRNLAPGQNVTINFPVYAHDLSYVNEEGEFDSKTGSWEIIVEDSKVKISVV